jgi:hypothetical protein
MTKVTMDFYGPVYGVTPNLQGQRIVVTEEKQPRYHQDTEENKSERKAFEQWYVCNAFDYESAPLGSHVCDLQWRAWLARAKQEAISL